MFLSNPSIPIYSSFPYNLALRETKEEKKRVQENRSAMVSLAGGREEN